MGKRPKIVYGKFDDITHLWAHEKQEEARCRNGFFEKDTIYSYGTHFPIARIYTDKKGNKTVFFTTRTYSSTTTQHVYATRRACSHMNMLYMKNPILYENKEDGRITWEHSYHHTNMMDFVGNIYTALEKFPAARESKRYLLQDACRELAYLNKYIDFFKLKSHLPKKIKDAIKFASDPRWIKEIEDFEKRKEARLSDPKLAEKREKARLAREKAEQKKYAEQIRKWKNFEAYRPYQNMGRHRHRWHLSNLPDLLRYNEDEQRIETSQGVQVPVEIARRFYFHIKNVISRGGCVTEDACAHKILDYSVREITAEHIRVGCHRIMMTEVEAMAESLGWVKRSPLKEHEDGK